MNDELTGYASGDREPQNPIFTFKDESGDSAHSDDRVFVYGKCNNIVCATDSRGHAEPKNASKYDLVVDATDGFIPLWAADVTLRWRFNQISLSGFKDPDAARAEIRKLFGEALIQWGDAAPIRFQEDSDVWDFEIVVRTKPNCDPNGCVLASAFFPDAGRHELTIFPTLFSQNRQEQVETLIHEIGHVFGLRHFFALISETKWKAEIFGKHDADNPFSIMNYGTYSKLTDDDRSDLKRLYELAWSGNLKRINGTPIRFVRPYHTVKDNPEGKFPLGLETSNFLRT